ncbi:MAG: ribonuclease H-like domain-containing protein [Firmicutes bacterium]|nr:ribonuclease H-like domain-containing protein [Alicyclobacillaceae bacterium]MCL6496059.1 ribonuclease H-like domain-containing protein [Bacillota bacterium]
MRPALLVDIETVFDAALWQRGRPEAALPRDERSLPKPLYHQVVAVAVCHLGPDGSVAQFKFWTGERETEVLGRFWEGFERLYAAAPALRLVTFNGRRFDLPVLVQRALYRAIRPSWWWQSPYRMRYREDHLDLMDFLSDYGATVAMSQHELAVLLGVPGKLGVDGQAVQGLWESGQHELVAAYCACDVATLTASFARLGVLTGWCHPEEALRIETGLTEALRQQADHQPLLQAWLEQAKAQAASPEAGEGA